MSETNLCRQGETSPSYNFYTYNTYEYDEFGNPTATYQNYAGGKKVNAVIYYNNSNLQLKKV